MAKIWKWLAIVVIILMVSVGSGLGYSLARTYGELADTGETLATTQTNLTSTQDELTSTQANLTSTKNDLKDTKNTLTSTQNNLQLTKDTLTTTQNTLETTQATLTSTKNDLANAIISLGQSQALVADYSQNLTKVQFQFDNLIKGYSYVTNNVSYQDTITFIASDQTNTKIYNVITYNCFNYSADVISHAFNQHIRCGLVYILFKDAKKAHAIVAFSTTDKGVIYIEPQTDNVVNLQIGKHYWTECLPPGLFSNPTTYDDTVESFVIIW